MLSMLKAKANLKRPPQKQGVEYSCWIGLVTLPGGGGDIHCDKMVQLHT